MQSLMNDVITLCEQAGQAILSVYHDENGFDVDTKDDNSPLTRADLAANRVLVNGLKAIKDVPILSEECEIPDFETRSQWPMYWLIDPLDGTKQFIQRNGEFTVNVALIDNNKAVLGVVYVPVKDITYAGCETSGAIKREEGVNTSISVRKATSIIDVVASRSHGASAVDQLMDALEHHFDQINTTNMGSSLKLCLVAEGKADLYPRLALTSEWDTAAAHAVVSAAGGTVIDDTFNDMRYNTKDNILNPYFYVIGDTSIDWQSIIIGAKNA